MKQEDKTYINEYLKKNNISSNELMWMCYMGRLADLTESQLDLYILGDMELMQREYIRIALILGISDDEAENVKNAEDIKGVLFKNQEKLKEQSKERDGMSVLSDILKTQKKILDKSEENINISNKLMRNMLKIPDFEMVSKLADKKAGDITERIEVLLPGKETPVELDKNILSRLTDKIKRKDKKKQLTDIFDILSGNNFSKQQAAELIDGLKNGLSAEAVMSYAKEEYSPEKMSELKEFLLMVKEQNENISTDNSRNVTEPGKEDDKNENTDNEPISEGDIPAENEYLFAGDSDVEQEEPEDAVYDEDFEEYEED